jgi:hypothetical protein
MAQPQTALIGLQFVAEEDVIFCSPVRNCVGYVSPVDAALEGSMENDESGMVAITVAADGSFLNAFPFMRCTDAEGATILFRTT